jgi:non-ribosomal peptide synthetase component F
VSGATRVLPDEPLLVPDAVLAWLARERVSVLHAFPALARAWLAAPVPLPLLRLVDAWRGAVGGAGLVVNLYGPTETTLAKCCFVVPERSEPRVQPVGRPPSETQALVVGADRLCRAGRTRGIVIRTPFRSRRYLRGRDDARRSRPNPVPGRRRRPRLRDRRPRPLPARRHARDPRAPRR